MSSSWLRMEVSCRQEELEKLNREVATQASSGKL